MRTLHARHVPYAARSVAIFNAAPASATTRRLRSSIAWPMRPCRGWVATGPRRGCRVLRLGTEPEDGEATIKSKRCAEVGGFNLHANVRVRANDREGIEHLCRDGRGEAAWGRGWVGGP
jgi:hypothetical protein